VQPSTPDESRRSGGSRVLVIPGLDGDPGLVRTAAPWLFRGMRVLPFDHRLDPMAGGVEGLAERALAVLDTDSETDAPAFVCGESFGGTAALTLARRHPARVRGLILLSAFGWYPSIFTCTPQLGLALWRVLGDRVAQHILQLWRPLILPLALGLPCSWEVARAYLRRPALHLPGYRAKCEVSLHFDARPWLDSINCPTFILIGTWDPVVPTRAGQELARRIPNARLHRLRGGHLAHVMRPAEAGHLISGWVADSKTTEAGSGWAAPAHRARLSAPS
jgi:pimeloyl-ACP methyl ester carboxylesterase